MFSLTAKRRCAYEYAIFQRSDLPQIWQGISGGGESGETIEQSALRECREEGGITAPGPLYRLDSISCMRSTVFPEWTPVWGKDIVVLPMYFFECHTMVTLHYPTNIFVLAGWTTARQISWCGCRIRIRRFGS